MKLTRIRKVFSISQKELSVFLGMSRTVVSMHELELRDLSLSVSNRVAEMYDLTFKDPEPSALDQFQQHEQQNLLILESNLRRQLTNLDKAIQYKETELDLAQGHYDRLKARFVALVHLREAIAETNVEDQAIKLKWLEKHELKTRYKLKTEGLSRLFQIELELDQLKSKQAFLQERVGK
jgi:transcriptional regulator with XRE-family HTH domain